MLVGVGVLSGVKGAFCLRLFFFLHGGGEEEKEVWKVAFT